MTPEQFYTIELERLRVEWEAGRFDALLDALVLSNDARPLPEWATLGAVNGLRLAAAGEPLPGTSRGRAGGIIPKLQQDDIHRRRWELSCWALGELQPAQSAADRKSIRREIALAFGKSKGTRPEAFQIVSEMLRKSEARGSPEAIEASYKLVNNAIRVGDASRFRVENSRN